MSREDEIMRLVREAAGDDAAFERGLVELARRDVQETVEALCATGHATPASRRPPSYEELAALGRRLASAAALVAHHEEGSPAHDAFRPSP